MKRLGLMFVLFGAFFLLTVGSAFADHGSSIPEVKVGVMASEKALDAAMDYNYDRIESQNYTSEVGPEIVASPKALLAAKLYRYDQPEAFAQISDEAGTSYFASEHQSASVHEAIANLGKEDTMCVTC